MKQTRLNAPIDIYKNPSSFSSEFAEPRKNQKGEYTPHHGIDITPDKCDSNPTEILSMQDGVVVKNGLQIGKNGKGYGNFVVIESLDGTGYMYAHLKSTLVSNGDSINSGKALGEMGETGAPGKKHLHIEKLTQEAIREIKKDKSTESVGIVGGTEGLKYRIDITEELLIAFENLASEYARQFAKEFNISINMQAHKVNDTNAVLKIIKKFLASLFDKKSKLTGIKKDGKGTTVMYQIDNKKWISVAAAIQMVKNGTLDGVIVRSSRGTIFLRTRPDNTPENNLNWSYKV